MLRRQADAGAAGSTDDHGHAHGTAEHITDFGSVVDDLVHSDQDEVDRHDLHDRAQTAHRRANAGADETLFRNRGGAHAPGSEFLEQPLRDAVGSLEDADLLTHDQDFLIAGQFLVQSLLQCLAISDFSHA